MLDKKITTAITALTTIATLVLATPAFAASDVIIQGNGAVSQNAANITKNDTETGVQNNRAVVTNTVNTTANTGNNSAGYNTDGTTTISTGNAQNVTDVKNLLNKNSLQLDSCACANGGTGILIGDNGAFATDTANASSHNNTSAFQNNTATVANDVTAKANTGWNTGNFNTNGDTTIFTGDAANQTTVATGANLNWAAIGGGMVGDTGTGFGTDLQEIGNGAQSANAINASTNNSALVSQDNTANVANAVNSAAISGQNKASDQTGGNTLIQTGSTANLTGVENLLNANQAWVANCGCANDSFFKINDNGAFASDAINGDMNNTTSVFGTNDATVGNNVTAKGASGDNTAAFETAGSGSVDPTTVMTGQSTSQTVVKNGANLNVAQSGALMTPWGAMDFGFSPSALIGGM